MSGRNRRFLLRSLCVFFVALCSLHLLAQTPATGEAPQSAPANEARFAPIASSAG